MIRPLLLTLALSACVPATPAPVADGDVMHFLFNT